MATKKDQQPDAAFGKAPEPEDMVVSEQPKAPVEVKPEPAPAPMVEAPRDLSNRPFTWGERACGVPFNPGGDPKVALLKSQFAAVVDTMHNLRESATDGEVQRMLSVAITEAQTAQMWAAKAVTWRG